MSHAGTHARHRRAHSRHMLHRTHILSHLDTHNSIERDVTGTDLETDPMNTETLVAADPPAADIDLGTEPLSKTLTHVDAGGRASMVDVGAKALTTRTAVARGRVLLGPEAFTLVRDNQMAKGDVLTVAQLAGIMGAKHTATLIPLCHNLFLSKVSVDLYLDETTHAIIVTGTAKCHGQTGVEMEALTAVSVAALTCYDMCKAVSHDIVISDIHLVTKRGGKSGDYDAALGQLP